jgi:hypothetical protein
VAAFVPFARSGLSLVGGPAAVSMAATTEENESAS